MENSLEKKQRVNLLMDLYEDLLTEKQKIGRASCRERV